MSGSDYWQESVSSSYTDSATVISFTKHNYVAYLPSKHARTVSSEHAMRLPSQKGQNFAQYVATNISTKTLDVRINDEESLG